MQSLFYSSGSNEYVFYSSGSDNYPHISGDKTQIDTIYLEMCAHLCVCYAHVCKHLCAVIFVCPKKKYTNAYSIGVLILVTSCSF